jgi:transcriptional regulator with XRE-family HTH domain/tetratricopeptide (TPR) repeat protein
MILGIHQASRPTDCADSSGAIWSWARLYEGIAGMGRKRRRMVDRRKTLGLSQEGLAEAMQVETSTVARWERGETTPQPWHRPRLADALKVTVEEVGELLAEADEHRPTAVAGYETLEASGPTREYEELDTNRREVLKLGPALLAATASPVTGVLGAKVQMDGLAAAVLRPNPAAEPTSIETLAAQGREAWRLRQLAGYDALAELMPSLIGQAEASVAALHGADQARAIQAAVHAYNAASSLLKTVGDCHLGVIAADRAVRLARTMDDPQLIAAALYRLANVLLAARRYPEATAVAVQAADLVDPGTGQAQRGVAIWGGLLLTAAVASARGGRAAETWQFLGEARAASRLVATEHADMYTIFGPTNFAIHGVQVAVELGDGHDALHRADAIDPHNLPETLRERRGQYLIDLTHAHVLLKDDESAVGVLRQAYEVAPQEVKLSSTAHGMVGTMLSRTRAGSAGELRQLADAIGFEGRR